MTESDGGNVRIVYRSHAGENAKNRPGYYSKHIALLSLLRSAHGLRDPEIVFLNDGPIPGARGALMAERGEVVTIAAGSNRASYRAAVAREAAGAGEVGPELVWFAEDDYLYRPEALPALVAGAATVSDADYFSLYGSEAVDAAAPRTAPRPRALPGAEGDPAAVATGDVTWYRAFSTTSTFGVRRRVLAQDARLLRLCPLTGGAWDHTTSLVLQGLSPFTPAELAADLTGRGGAGGARSVLRGLARSVLAARALRRPARRRVLLGSDPELVRHLELPTPHPRTPASPATQGFDWEALAGETIAWAQARGLPVPAVDGAAR